MTAERVHQPYPEIVIDPLEDFIGPGFGLAIDNDRPVWIKHLRIYEAAPELVDRDARSATVSDRRRRVHASFCGHLVIEKGTPDVCLACIARSNGTPMTNWIRMLHADERAVRELWNASPGS